MIDARGKACPQPVLMMKAALDEITEGVVSIIVDNRGSSINVKNFCESNGCEVTVTEKDGCWQIDAAKGYQCAVAETAPKKDDLNIVVFISGECIGSEEPELGKMLMNGFVGNLINLEPKVKTVIMVNNGVRLATTNPDTSKALKELENSGVEVLSCGICLNHYNLMDELKAGKVTDAHTVGTKLVNADRVVRL